jgi:hypothetical protein
MKKTLLPLSLEVGSEDPIWLAAQRMRKFAGAGGKPFHTSQTNAVEFAGAALTPACRRQAAGEGAGLDAASLQLSHRTVTSLSDPRCVAEEDTLRLHKKTVPNLAVAFSTGFRRFRTASTGSGPILFHNFIKKSKCL